MCPHHTQKTLNSQGKNMIFPIYKHAGETLASLVERFRNEESINEDIPITYAGRLDPMADGLVLLLTGEKCKEKDSFLGLDKVYTFEVLFEVSTDTFDMLGLITEIKEVGVTEEQIKEALIQIKNKTVFSYPPFSSKPVGGTPLFMHAKAGTLPETLPTIKGEIKSIELKKVRSVPIEQLVKSSLEIIKKVKGDFRQEEVVKGWQKFLEQNRNKSYFIATCEAKVSSGVYIRSIAVSIGEMLNASALAYSITRESVGEYKI